MKRSISYFCFWIIVASVLEVLGAPDDRFFGGDYDGHAGDVYFQYESSISPQSTGPRFRGGDYDGHAQSAFSQYDPGTSPQGISPRFVGGEYDGHALSAFSQYDPASSPQGNAPRFLGGPYDGADQDQIAGLVNPLDRDSDLDGLPDWWELPYFGGVTNADALADDDNDGSANWTEYPAGTVPTNSASVLKIEQFDADAVGEVVVSWQSVTGKTYRLHRCEDLTSGLFTNIATGIAATPVLNVYTDAAAPQAFHIYRIEVE